VSEEMGNALPVTVLLVRRVHYKKIEAQGMNAGRTGG